MCRKQVYVFELFIQMFFGWPAMILSLGLALAGVLFKRTSLSLISAVLFMAPAWYLSHYFFLLGSLPFFPLLSAQAIARQRTLLALLCIVPMLLVMGSLGYVVLTQ